MLVVKVVINVKFMCGYVYGCCLLGELEFSVL